MEWSLTLSIPIYAVSQVHLLGSVAPRTVATSYIVHTHYNMSNSLCQLEGLGVGDDPRRRGRLRGRRRHCAAHASRLDALLAVGADPDHTLCQLADVDFDRVGELGQDVVSYVAIVLFEWSRLGACRVEQEARTKEERDRVQRREGLLREPF